MRQQPFLPSPSDASIFGQIFEIDSYSGKNARITAVTVHIVTWIKNVSCKAFFFNVVIIESGDES